VTNPRQTPNAQAALFMEHARWVMEWHNKRAEGAATRAVAVLGFAGVMLALLVQGAGLDALHPTEWTWRLATAGAVLLLLAALFALFAISTKTVRMHNLKQLRSWWGEYGRKPGQDFSHDLTETLLLSQQLSEDSPVTTAEREATSRVCWFKLSVWTLGLALVDLAVLGLNILHLTRGDRA
jgi:MFS family permease